MKKILFQLWIILQAIGLLLIIAFLFGLTWSACKYGASFIK